MVELDFEPDTHTYRSGGVVMPSVTQILKPMYDFRFVDPVVLQDAATFGTLVHLTCELYDIDDLVMDSVDASILPYLGAWIRFLAEKVDRVLQVEQRYYHKAHAYAGTLDRVLAIKREPVPVLTDIKTVSQLSPAVGIQLAAYEKLLDANTELGPVRRAAVQLCGDGTYRYRMYAEAMDWPMFLSLLTVNNWRARHAA